MKREVIVIGVSHHTAPLELREQLAVGGTALSDSLAEFSNSNGNEAVILSTCNRVEYYASTDDPAGAAAAARELLAARVGENERIHLDDALYTRSGEEAVRHVFRVASSLDSMVVGEPQILGQLKAAVDTAQTAGTVGTLLGRCMTRAFAVAKRVRNETTIAEGTVSISSIASALARKIFGELSGRRVLLLGAGEMGEAAAKSLANTGAILLVVNRSPQKAIDVAATCGGEVRGYEQLASELVKADVVITSTSSERFVLDEEMMRGVVGARRHRPLFLIDIAVPRDVDPRVGTMENVFLYDIDDLKQVADSNLALRRSAADDAERIVNIEVVEFETWRRSLDLTPTIVGLRDRFSEVVAAEIARTTMRLDGLSDRDRQVLERMSGAIVNKLLHTPLSALKSPGEDGGSLIAATRRLFELDRADEVEEDEPVRSGKLVKE